MAKKNLHADLARQSQAFRNLIEKQLPEHLAAKMEDLYHQSFEQEQHAFMPAGKWQKRKPTQNRTVERGQGTSSYCTITKMLW